MKAILIDPFTESISEVDFNGDYKHIYTLLTDPQQKVSCFTTVQVGEQEVLFVDDEGLLKNPTHFFKWKDYHQPLSGRGLILGLDDEGDNVATKLTLDYVKSQVEWKNNLQLDRFDQIPAGTKTNHPAFGEMFVVGHRPVFSEKKE